MLLWEGMKTISQKQRNKKKQTYRIRNWHQYNESLVKRGSIILWLDTDAVIHWHSSADKEAKKEGRPFIYSDKAIETILTLGKVYHLPLRGLEGFMRSITSIITFTKNIRVPDYSTYSRRGQNLVIQIRKKEIKESEDVHVVVDSTGVKVFGEGEWKVRQHGYSKRRTWKKIHIAVNEKGEIIAEEATGNDTHDADAITPLLSQIQERVASFGGDGAYDKRNVYDALLKRGITDIRIPPQHNAKIWKHGNSKDKPHPRDENLRAIRSIGRNQWKEQSGYHTRSRIEATMFRFKTIRGERIQSRVWKNQVTELKLACKILNRMLYLGMPESYPVA